VEANRENPSDDLIERVAKVFGVDADELLIVARRVPLELVEEFAADPAQALSFLRTWKKRPS